MGSSNSLVKLKEVANAWQSVPTTFAIAGHVKIIEGNMYSINVEWDKNGVRYNMFFRGDCDGKAIAEVLNSFGNTSASTPTAKNIVSRIDKYTKIPVFLPQTWKPFAEYNKSAVDYVYKSEGDFSDKSSLYERNQNYNGYFKSTG